jgi:hypothetical protein
MADTMEIDLSTLELAFEDGRNLGLRGLHGCVPEVSISPETLSAFFANDQGRVDSAV